ncbi:hypothetical protein ACFB49_08320 [Sphingomonas sp. DBB INV C78]|uniref:DUF6603 domain-containing protein n=1 Tax=Sphingomonas sp. DBB INV C78 TaxID=3349434 RepID=UPI0036D343F6
MSERSILQRLAGLIADFASDISDLGIPEVRAAVLADLGGKPGTSGNVELPPTALSAVLHYRDALDPDAQAEAEAIGNIAILLGAIIDQIEAWDADWPARGDAFIYALFDLLASNYARRTWPKLFLILQAIASAIELTETHGPGERAHARFVNAFMTIFAFVWNPGRTLDDLDDTTEGASGGTLETARDKSFLVVDGAMRGLLATLAVIDQIKDEFSDNILGDVIVGWDASALDVDSRARPTAADLVASRMVSAVIHRGDADDEEQLRVSWLYLPRRLGVPPRPHQLFLTLGGELTIDQVINPDRAQGDPAWHFRADIRSDTGASWLISGTDSKVSATAETSQVSVGWTAMPNEAGISYTIHSWPRSLGVRLELGSIATALTLSGAGARILFRTDRSAIVIDGESRDSFVRKLLGGRPIRYAFSFALGYDSQLGFIHEVHKPSSTDATGAEPPFDSSGPAGPSDLDMTLPLGGGGVLGINVHEIVLRLAYRKATAPETGRAVAAGVLISFSTTLGPVYLRVDRLGLAATVDTMTPSSDRNLCLVQAGVDAAAPLGIAIQVDTGPISGGGTIQHDPASGDYVGALVLRLGKRITLTCVGLASTKDRNGTAESSLILIGTVEHLDLRAGFVTFDGFGLIYAADRRIDEIAVRAALPTGQLRHILFPADPVKHLPELVSTLRTFFPVQAGVHSYGILVKLLFGAGHPLIRADLALLLERDSVADRSRLIVLGRISSALPQDKDAILRLNLDAIGVFDLDSGEMAVDAVLYESRLCGRFVLTGAAAFRRTPGEGFALAVGGFNPRFQPPTGFPIVPRVTIALTAGDNPKLIVQAYFALTSNTVQFGARASLYAAAYGFSIEGYVGFDVLIQLWPPHFIAEFQAGVQLKRGSHNLFKVDVRGMLEGPVPLRLAGKATFGILWWDYTVGFDRTLIGGSQSVATETLDVLTELVTRLSNPTSWRAEPLPAAAQIVSVRTGTAGGPSLLLHPLGRLEVRQGVVPFNLDRDIDRVGAFVPANDTRRFAITSATVGGSGVGTEPVFDDFPDGQFFDLSDAERLAAPDFVLREAGVAFGLDQYRTDTTTAVPSPVAYTEITVGDDGVPVVAPDPQPPPLDIFDMGFRIGAAARAEIRTGRAERYAEAVLADAPRVDAQRRRA